MNTRELKEHADELQSIRAEIERIVLLASDKTMKLWEVSNSLRIVISRLYTEESEVRWKNERQVDNPDGTG